ncbi:MAG: biosynthetic-type acetolactate synthase large subunit, partial [Candidatus Lokiarchaeota archaeon]|nr:biosynthetic-type acetolactate synthase large subunit [Candidatus Lokiarchaeota archaeon]
MNGSRALAESLLREGVKDLFGITGGAIMNLMHQLFEFEEIRVITARHEQCAAHMAEGYAVASGEVGVCFATSGPGATNLVTGIADAFLDSRPIVAITGQVPTSLVGNDAFQEADIIGATMPMTKANFQFHRVKDIPLLTKMAFKIAKTGRPGPVLLDFPKNIQIGEEHVEFPTDIEISGYNPTLKGHPRQIKRISKVLKQAERPIMIAGGGTISAMANNEVLELAEMLGLPVINTLMGKGIIPETHPLSLGMAGMHGHMCANSVINQADLIFAVGMRWSDRITGKLEYFAQEATIVHVDIDSAEIGKNVGVHYPIVGDAKIILRQIIEELKKLDVTQPMSWMQKVKQLKERCQCNIPLTDIQPIKPQQVMRLLREHIDSKTILTTGVGRNQMWAAHYLRVYGPRKFVTSGGLGTMGFGFPAAIGAKVAKPDHWVVDVDGDGSFLMTQQELATSVIEDIPVTVIILNDQALGMVRQWQNLFFEERYAVTDLGPKGFEKRVPDFAKLAEAFGANGILVERVSEIGPAIKEAKESDVTTVIDVQIDRSE